MARTAAQERAGRAMKAFWAKHGRAPRKGESIMGGRVASRSATRPKAKAAAADAPRKKRRKKPDLTTQAWRWMKRNPWKTATGVAVVGTGVALAASDTVREAVAEKAAEGTLAVSNLFS